MAGYPAFSLGQALNSLSDLQSVSTPQIATTLAQITALLQNLADENTYLNTLLSEGISTPVVEDLPRREVKTVTAYLLTGLNEVMRPPLIAIRGRAELVQGGMLGQITPEQEQWLQAIHENTDRAFAMLDAVQQVIALQNGEVYIEWMNFISTDLLSEAYERVRDNARARQHEITIQAPEVVPLARGDFYQTLIILTDLLDNAIRYTPIGGQIRLSVDNLGTHVLFSVADNGIGLSDEDVAHVGEAFWRAEHQRLVRQHPGTGLRLFLARSILALQEGELIFSGEPEVGSTFSFTLLAPE
jgi:signal transduction histidine kinase